MSQIPDHVSEKVVNETHHHIENGRVPMHVVKSVHTDGTVDYVDTHAVGGELEEMPRGYYTSLSFIMTFIAICLQQVIAYLGFVVPINTLALINEEIGPTNNLNWVATTWTLGSSIGFLVFGRISDIFGRKYVVIGNGCLSIIGLIIGATAQHTNVLIGANLLNGISAAGQLSFSTIIGELVPNKFRGPAIAVIFASSLPFAVFGGIIGRDFIEHTSQTFRWSFYIGIIIGVLSLVMLIIWYNPPSFGQLHVGGKTKWQQFKEFDFIGLILFVAGTLVFLIGVAWGGQTYPWKSSQVIATMIVGGCCLIFFGFYEAYIFKGQALMPTRMFKNVGFVAICVAAGTGASVYYSLNVIWPPLLSAVYGFDVQAVGIRSAVVGGGVLLGQMLGGFGMSLIPKVKWQAILFSTMASTFVAALAALNQNTYALTIAFGLLGCIFTGYVDNITFPGVTLVFEPQDIGVAVGIMGSIRALIGAVAQSVYVTVLENKLATYLPEYVTPAALNAGLPQSSLPALFEGITAGNFSAVPGINTNIETVVGEQVVRAYVSSFHIVFYATIPFGVFFILGSMFIPNMEDVLHYKVARRLQHLGGSLDGEAQDGKSLEEISQTESHP